MPLQKLAVPGWIGKTITSSHAFIPLQKEGKQFGAPFADFAAGSGGSPVPPGLKIAFTGTGDPVNFVGTTENPSLQAVDLVDESSVRLANGRKKANYRQSPPMDVEESVPIGEMPEVSVLEEAERHLPDPR